MEALTWLKLAIAIGIIIGVLTLGSWSCVTVQPGTVGVVTHFGAVQDEILPEGFHWITPVKTKVIEIDVRVQKLEDMASASSKDLQVVTSTVALNYYLKKDRANIIFQELGPLYRTNIMEPAIQESVKSSTAQFTAEELVTRRPEVKGSIFESIERRLEKYSIVVTDFSIVNFQFSSEFNKATEDKQIAEQRALRAINDLQRIKTEAEQARAIAEGQANAQLVLAQAEAEAQKLLRETLTAQVIQLRAIEKWNGVLPSVSAGDAALPFLELNPTGASATR